MGDVRLVSAFGLVPLRLTSGNAFGIVGLCYSSMFLHGGWLHFLSNMWILYIFGDNVEDRMGSIPYLIFYVLSGLAAGLLQTFIDPASSVPVIGASGAIAGIMGAYILALSHCQSGHFDTGVHLPLVHPGACVFLPGLLVHYAILLWRSSHWNIGRWSSLVGAHWGLLYSVCC